MNELLPNLIKMDNPNDQILIYEGQSTVKFENETETVHIKIFRSWIPLYQNIFSFKLKKCPLVLFEANGKLIEIFADKHFTWNGTITEINENDESEFLGYLNLPITAGDKKFKIRRLDFSLFNFRTYSGNVLKVGEKSWRTGELSFDTDDHYILIHSLNATADQQSIQRKKGGFIQTNICRISFKEEVSFERIKSLQKRLGLFLSFINGRKTYPNFLTGYDAFGNVLWEDFTQNHIDQYKFVVSWLPFKVEKGFVDLWGNFLLLTKEDADFEKISLVIHWYLEALNNSGRSIGSIFMIQTAFEILYNWLVKEEDKIKVYNTKDPDVASNKFRTLINHYKLSLELPEIYSEYSKNRILLKKNGDKKKPPFGFSFWYAEVRNMYVHFSKIDGDNQKLLPDNFDWYLLNTGIFNLEGILLKMMNYDGLITSRLQEDKWRGGDQVHINSPYVTISLK